ncbi:MAG: TMEM198/TM7SF3 family protein [Saccharofermentans sp.]|nr:TMEM198/TM7SF3 family protein [Saccharofermentans sp.]
MDLMSLSGFLPSIFMLIAGILVCGYGYRFFRLSVTLVGASIGFSLGVMIATTILASLSPVFHWIIVGVFTIGIGSVAFAFYQKAIILICTIGVGYWFVNDYAEPSVRNWAIGLGIGLVVGFAAFFLQKAAIMLVTSVAGAKMITTAALPYIFMFPMLPVLSKRAGEFVFRDVSLPPEVFVPGVLTIIIAAFGFSKQLKDDKK